VSEKSSGGTQKSRIQTLSDLIFGLALSISALTLIDRQPANTQELFTSLGLYGFSFLILISVWRSYSSITSVLPSETSMLTDLNIILLFLVSIEPYLFNELFVLKGDLLNTLSNTYALDLACMFIILAFFNHSLAQEEKKLVSKSQLGRYRLARNSCLINAAIFIISTAPVFGSLTVLHYTAEGLTYDFTLRGILWVVALLAGYSRRFLERRVKS